MAAKTPQPAPSPSTKPDAPPAPPPRHALGRPLVDAVWREGRDLIGHVWPPEDLRAWAGEIDSAGPDGFAMSATGRVREIMITYAGRCGPGCDFETVGVVAAEIADDLRRLAQWVEDEAI